MIGDKGNVLLCSLNIKKYEETQKRTDALLAELLPFFPSLMKGNIDLQNAEPKNKSEVEDSIVKLNEERITLEKNAQLELKRYRNDVLKHTQIKCPIPLEDRIFYEEDTDKAGNEVLFK